MRSLLSLKNINNFIKKNKGIYKFTAKDKKFKNLNVITKVKKY